MSYEITNTEIHEANHLGAIVEFTITLPEGDSALVPMTYTHKRGDLQLTPDCDRDVEEVGRLLEEDDEALSEARELFLVHRDELREKN